MTETDNIDRISKLENEINDLKLYIKDIHSCLDALQSTLPKNVPNRRSSQAIQSMTPYPEWRQRLNKRRQTI
jgi:hypothetical protein